MLRVDNLGSVGLNKDLQPWQLPSNAWTTLNNIRCKDGEIESFAGHDDLTTPSIVPYYLLPVAAGSSYYWMYPGLDKVYVYDGTTHTDITRASGDYTGGADNRWNGCLINGIPVLNNGVDDPQMWNPVSTSTDLDIITGWDTDDKAKVIRSYKDALVALYLTKSGTDYPYLVKFSAGGSGGFPTDWDHTSTTNDAKEFSLGETLGFLVDGLLLRDTFVIYKDDSVYGCQYIGGEEVYRAYRISGLVGAMAQGCIAEVPGGHFVVGNGDVYVHDGQNGRTVIDNANRDYLFNSIDGDNYANTFVAPFHSKSEVWICYPENGETFPNKALIWNYEDNTWFYRDLPTGTTFIAPGIIVDEAYTYETMPWDSYDDWPAPYGVRSYSPVSNSLVAVTTGTKLYKLETGNQFDGVSASCIAERTGLNIGDNSELHTVTRIYPDIQGDPVDIYVGYQMFPNDTVTWEGPYSFDPSTDRKIDCRVTGVLHGIRYQSSSDVSWSSSGYSAEFKYAGGR